MDKVLVVVEADSGPFTYVRSFDPANAGDARLRRHPSPTGTCLKEIPRDLWERFQQVEREYRELEAAIDNAPSPSVGEPNA